MTPRTKPLSSAVSASCSDGAEDFLSRCSRRFSRQLEKNFADRQDSPLIEAMRYACSGGGKRFRPGLVYAAAEALKVPAARVDAAACAVELIHTYSLIHDDLPAMDDDGMRRGRPTVHKAFDEATAILAGDALHDMAFEIIGRTRRLNKDQKIRALQILAAAAGTEGMSGGQMLDVLLTGKQKADKRQIEKMHRLKTGSLIQACVHMVTACAEGVGRKARTALLAYAKNIGPCFQLRDDVLDMSDDEKDLSKPNYALLFGLQKTEQKLEELLQSCCACLSVFPEKRRQRLVQLTWYAGRRSW